MSAITAPASSAPAVAPCPCRTANPDGAATPPSASIPPSQTTSASTYRYRNTIIGPYYSGEGAAARHRPRPVGGGRRSPRPDGRRSAARCQTDPTPDASGLPPPDGRDRPPASRRSTDGGPQTS